jgi:hypothetical protein
LFTFLDSGHNVSPSDSVINNVLATQRDNWLASLMLNLIAYGAIIIPCTLVVRYLKDSDKVKHGTILSCPFRINED